MPPRKSHKKSRAGCLRCKQRKVKCDELHPACGNCTKHGVACDFDDRNAITSPTLTASSSSGSVVKYFSRSPSASYGAPLYTTPQPSTVSYYSATSRAMELRLLHNYTTLTSKTLASVNTPLTEAAWQIAVPQLAYNHPCLMDAILAVSALHLRSLEPDDQSLVRAFHGYMASSLSSYTACLQAGVTAANAEALFTTSALIAFQASATRRFMNEPSTSPDEFGYESYTLPVQWFHSFQGVKTVVLASWKWLRDSEAVRPIIAAQPALALDLNPSQTAIFSQLLDGLDEQLAALDESARADTRQAYEQSVAYLNWAHARPDKSRVVGFPATVSRRFILLIDAQDPRALAIIACFFAMTRAVDESWWLRGVARKEVEGIMTLLPVEWWPRLEWAVRIVQHEGLLDEAVWGNWEGTRVMEQEGGKETAEYVDVSEHIDLLAQFDPAVTEGTAYSGVMEEGEKVTGEYGDVSEHIDLLAQFDPAVTEGTAYSGEMEEGKKAAEEYVDVSEHIDLLAQFDPAVTEGTAYSGVT